MKSFNGYDHVRLSPDEAAIYLGIARRDLRDWCRKYRMAYADMTPYTLDRAMGWRGQYIHKAQPARRPHPDILPVIEPPPRLDSNPADRASIAQYTPAQPYGSSTSTEIKYRRPRAAPHRAGSTAPASVTGKAQDIAREPQSRRQAQGQRQQGSRRDRDVRAAVRP